jgi:hypothetical protein
MTMPMHEHLYLDLLTGAADALERGDWRTAMVDLGRPEPSSNRPAVISLAVCLRCVARSMRYQCVLGEVESAEYQLNAATDVLRGADRKWPLQYRGEPPTSRRYAHLVWAATRLVLREVEDLAALRDLVKGLPRGRAELICAYVEFLTWVEFDPWTIRVHPEERTLLVPEEFLDEKAYERFSTANRGDLTDRASKLRQFADPRRGPVSVKVWRGMGGCRPLREAALRTLADEELIRGLADAPVRVGRRRAWESACTLVNDIKR